MKLSKLRRFMPLALLTVLAVVLVIAIGPVGAAPDPFATTVNVLSLIHI